MNSLIKPKAEPAAVNDIAESDAVEFAPVVTGHRINTILANGTRITLPHVTSAMDEISELTSFAAHCNRLPNVSDVSITPIVAAA